MRLLSWILTLPIAVAVVLFAISNRESVTLTLWPTPFSAQAPVYLAVLAAMVAGFLLGGIVAWLSQGRYRRRARDGADHIAALEREVRDARTRAEAAEKRLAEQARPISGQAPTLNAPPGGGGPPAVVLH